MFVVQFEGDDRIERFASRIAADFCLEFILADFLENLGQGKNLGNGFNGKFVLRIADFKYVAIGKGDGNAEEVGRNRGQIGNIAGIGPFLDRSELLVSRGHKVQHLFPLLLILIDAHGSYPLKMFSFISSAYRPLVGSAGVVAHLGFLAFEVVCLMSGKEVDGAFEVFQQQ